ncbi:MAG: hypothetical protein M1600_09115, partial [Firmicutes bacterium]|nr:hypothetical protein [Bacillota bacterium]
MHETASIVDLGADQAQALGDKGNSTVQADGASSLGYRGKHSTCTVAQIGSLSTSRPGIRPPIAIPILRPCTSGRAPDC